MGGEAATGEPTEVLAARHRRACRGFASVVHAVPAGSWAAPTPCTEWDARALVEHVIGFHEFLLLRPLGVRAHRPRQGAAARWLATQTAIETALADPSLSAPVDYFDGHTRRPVEVLSAITGDVVLHTWDLARAVGAPDHLDPELCALAYEATGATTPAGGGTMFALAVSISPDATTQDRLVARSGRDPAWRPAPVTDP